MNRQPWQDVISPLSREELTRAEEHIRCRLSGRVRDLRLLVRDQGLVLQGHAHTYYAKQLAQHAVMETLGLAIHANEIEVSSALVGGPGGSKPGKSRSNGTDDGGVTVAS